MEKRIEKKLNPEIFTKQIVFYSDIIHWADEIKNIVKTDRDHIKETQNRG